MKVETTAFPGTVDDKQAKCIRVENKWGLAIELLTYGATLRIVEMPDRSGKSVNITLAFDRLEDYRNSNAYFGASVGRFANRIGNSRFVLDGNEYPLKANIGEHQLHGGPGGFSHCFWEYRIEEGRDSVAVVFSLTSPDGDQGFPGSLQAEVTYTLSEQNQLVIDYRAVTDRPTVVNFTNHAYWNLAGAGSGDIYDHVLQLSSSRILEYGESAIPTGKILDMSGTGFDFTEPTAMGENQKKSPEGWDHCFVFDDQKEGLREVARLLHPKTGRCLAIDTDQPSVQLYSAKWMEEMTGAEDKPYQANGAVCLETQNYPDAPNHPHFPSAVLRPGEEFTSRTVHRFSLLD